MLGLMYDRIRLVYVRVTVLHVFLPADIFLK